MAVFKVKTEFPYSLSEPIRLWKREVKMHAIELSKQLSPAYIVFIQNNITYIYFLKDISLRHDITTGDKIYDDIYDDSACPVYCDPAIDEIYDEIYDASACPVYCNPAIDMSENSIINLAAESTHCDLDPLYNLPYAEYPIKDITIEDVATYYKQGTELINEPKLMSASVYDHVDDEIRRLCKFVSDASPDCNTLQLKSFIAHILQKKGYDIEMFDGDVIPEKHTELELRSELMKCNIDMYIDHKKKITYDILLAIINDSKSKPEMEHGLSSLAYEMLCDHVVYSTGSLWCFVDDIWKEYSSDGCIWNFLTSQLILYLTINNADKIAMHVKSVNVRGRILKDIKLRLQDDFFYKLLNCRTDVIHMRNGIYNTYNMQLSKPVPSDYISVTAGVPYQVFDDKSAKMVQLLQILGSIFPDKTILDFFILSCSTFLEGYNSQKVFYIWWGTGNNAKTLVQTLVMRAFGDYCSTGPISLVTGKRADSANATPELCHVEKKLVVFLQEPNPDEKIKAGRMKEMTGNDSMYIRQLFKPGRAAMLKAKFVIVCNNIIEIPGMDSAIRRRMVVIPFVSTFLDKGEYYIRKSKGILEEGSNIIDLSVEKDLLSCKNAFMYLLCRRYNEWINSPNQSLDSPDIIRNISEEYITRNNYPLKFIKTFVHYEVGSVIPTAEVYELFKEWFRKSYPGKKVYDFDRFAKELSEEGYHDNGYNLIENVFISYNAEQTN